MFEQSASHAAAIEPPRGLFRRIFAHAFAPVMVGVPAALHIYWGTHGGGGFPHQMIFVSIFTWFFLYLVEALLPYRRDWNYPFRSNWKLALRELAVDVGYHRLIGQITRPIDYVVELLIITRLSEWRQGFGYLIWPTHAPLGVRIALAFVIQEVLTYWIHRASHETDVLWRVHSIHHSSTRLNWIKAGRQHPLEGTIFGLPIDMVNILLGADPLAMAVSRTLSACMTRIAHTNLDLSDVGYGWIFTTPGQHRIHHSVTIDESKSNYGCALILCDKIFATYRRPTRDPSFKVGIEPAIPLNPLRHLIHPFLPRRSVAAASSSARAT